MSGGWFDKAKEVAKEAAQKAADGAKNLAETAKNANYSELLDKTKSMAKQAAEEARDAANNMMHKEQANPLTDIDEVDVPGQPMTLEQKIQECNLRIAQAEKLLQEAKDLLANIPQQPSQ